LVSFLKNLLVKNDRSGESTPVDTETRIRVATCVILVEMANSDDDFTEAERDHIIDVLENRFDLSRDDAQELIGVAERELEKSIDLYRFANTIKDSFPEEERIRVLEEIWKVVYTDGELSGHEDNLAHKLSFLLGLTHKQMIEAKLKAKKGS
jgi:uncharacterized tellurite resistance protein B-like protein